MKSAHNYNYRSEDGVFFLYDGDEQVLTPEDIPVSTRSEALAERLVADAAKYKGSFTDPGRSSVSTAAHATSWRL